MGLLVLVFGMCCSDSMSSIFAGHLDFFLPLRAVACLGPTASVLDLAYLDFSLPLRSLGRSGPALLASDFSHVGLSLPLRSLARAGSLVLLFSIARMPSTLPALGATTMGLSLPLRSPALLGFLVPVPDPGLTDPTSLLRSLARSGPAVPAPDPAHAGLSSSLRSSQRLGFLALPLGAQRLNSISVCESLLVGPSMSSQSPARPGPAAPRMQRLSPENGRFEALTLFRALKPRSRSRTVAMWAPRHRQEAQHTQTWRSRPLACAAQGRQRRPWISYARSCSCPLAPGRWRSHV